MGAHAKCLGDVVVGEQDRRSRPARSRKRSPSCSRPAGSTPANGSSQTRTRGGRVIARASSSLRRSPPDSSPARTSRRCSRPTRVAAIARVLGRQAARCGGRRPGSGAPSGPRARSGPAARSRRPRARAARAASAVTSCARQLDRALRRAGLAHQDAEERRLARPRGPEHPQHLARRAPRGPPRAGSPCPRARTRTPVAADERPPRPGTANYGPLATGMAPFTCVSETLAVAISMRAVSAVSQPWPRVSFTPPRRSSTCLVRSSSPRAPRRARRARRP